MSAQERKSFAITYDEFRVLVEILLREREAHLEDGPHQLDVDEVTGEPTVSYVNALLAQLGYGPLIGDTV